jgi:hypothetical protein
MLSPKPLDRRGQNLYVEATDGALTPFEDITKSEVRKASDGEQGGAAGDRREGEAEGAVYVNAV